MKIKRLARLTVLPLLTLGWTGCADKQLEEADIDTSKKPSDFGYQTSVQTALLLEGRKSYEQYCIGCHGINGDGKGDAARFLNPAPRSFVKANFKFSSTRSGQLPTDKDLYQSISTGLRGSSMPSWAFLPERTRQALVAYIKTFSDRWKTAEQAPAIPVYTDPFRNDEDKSAAIERGRTVYHGFFNCWACHPSYAAEQEMKDYMVALGGTPPPAFRPDLRVPAIKATSEGETIFAPDFLRDQVRAGTDVTTLYRSIAAGITGTAMPTWIDLFDNPPTDADGKPIVTRDDLWAMAYYVHDLIKQRPPRIELTRLVVRDKREVQFGPDGARFTVEVPGLSDAGAEGDENWDEGG